MIKRLNPKRIVVYGGKVEYDCKDSVVVYFKDATTERWKTICSEQKVEVIRLIEFPGKMADGFIRQYQRIGKDGIATWNGYELPKHHMGSTFWRALKMLNNPRQRVE